MTPLQAFYLVLGLLSVAQCNLLLRLPQTIAAAIWLSVMTAVVSLSWYAMFAVELIFGLCRTNVHGGLVSTDLSSSPMGRTVCIALIYPVLLTYTAGVSETLMWRDSLLLGGVVSGCVAFLEQQLEMWPRRCDLKFRAVSGVLCGLALLCTALLWSFHVTSPRYEDSFVSLVQYMIIMWDATLTIGLLKLFIFAGLHAWYSFNVLRGRAGSTDFDPTEEAGLSIRLCASLILLAASVEHFPNYSGILVHFVIMFRVCEVLNAASLLLRLRRIVDSFPEVGTAVHCVICFDPITQSERGRQLRCGHIFHSRCLRRWLMRAARCPTCRQYAFQHEDTLIPVEMFYDIGAMARNRVFADQGVPQTRTPRELRCPSHSVGVQTPAHHVTHPVSVYGLPHHAGHYSGPSVGASLELREAPTDGVNYTSRDTSTLFTPLSTPRVVVSSVHLDEFTDIPILGDSTRGTKRRKGVATGERTSGSDLRMERASAVKSTTEPANDDGGTQGVSDHGFSGTTKRRRKRWRESS